MNSADLIALGAAALVITIYGLYLLCFSGYDSRRKKENLGKRINLGLQNTDSRKENISLLKATPETYFKSKLPKVEGLKEWIQHSGLEINPTIFALISIFIGIITTCLLFFIIQKNLIIVVLLGIISSFLIPWSFIALLTRKRKNKFLEEFPIALDIIRRALKAGHSTDRGITTVVEQVSGPVGIAFKQMLEKLNLGKSLEDVLAEMANRIGIDDFRMLAIVLVLQRETGVALRRLWTIFPKLYELVKC